VTDDAADATPPSAREGGGMPHWLALLLASACGLIVANIYYAQPLAGPIAAALGMHPGAAGLIVTLTQVGYGIGLLFVVPLGDLVENRRLVLVLVGSCTRTTRANSGNMPHRCDPRPAASRHTRA